MTQPTGVHFLLELRDSPAELLNDLAFVKTCILEATNKAELNVIEIVGHAFEPVGVTAIALLAESHLSIHCWPERNFAAIDLFSCGSKASPQVACDCLIKSLQAKSHELRVIERNIP